MQKIILSLDEKNLRTAIFRAKDSVNKIFIKIRNHPQKSGR